MKLEIYQGQTGLEKIESKWVELFNTLDNPIYTQSSIWHKAYIQHLCVDRDKCYYFCILRNNKLIAIFPLELSLRKFFFLKLNSLGFSQHDHSGLNSVIVDENENTGQVFDFLFHSLKKDNSIKWNLIYLERAMHGTQVASCIISDSKLTFQSSCKGCNTLTIQAYDKTFDNLSKNFKKNINKARKKLYNADNFEFKSSTDPETLPDYYEIFLTVEASGWKGKTGQRTGIKLDNNLKAFYRQVMHEFSQKNQIEINVLTVENKPIAVQYAIILEPTVFLLKIGYDEEYSKLSPGTLLIEYKLKEYSNNSKLKKMSLISVAHWHREWKPITLHSNNLYHCKNILVAYYFRFILWLRHLYRVIKVVGDK